MRVLVLSDEVWNDKINGNNITSNWFEGMNAQFANIYASPGEPYNKCCDKYFQITDMMMFKSILCKNKAGKIINSNNNKIEKEEKIYKKVKKITGDFLRLIREFIWLIGKYDENELKKFIDDFKPDLVFSERMATCKMLRLERKVMRYTNVPIYAFTGDDEYTLKQISLSPFYWIRRLMIRKMLRKNVKNYKIYYTLSSDQKELYEKIFKCNMKILHKCGEFNDEYKEKNVNMPIKIVYAGKFYCNRWKVLVEIANEIKKINNEEIKFILEIYTKDIPTKKQEKLLNNKRDTFIKGPVTQEQLADIYKNSDIALHVESSDIKNKLVTRYSFSTKIIDCIFSTCAIIAFCPKIQSGWKYLKNEDAAMCVSSKEELSNLLNLILKDNNIIKEYSKKAYECGIKNHKKGIIQYNLIRDFNKE